MIAIGEGEQLFADGRAGGDLELAHAPMSVGFLAVLDLALDHARMPSGRPLKSRMRAQTFSTGASMTLEIMTVGMDFLADSQVLPMYAAGWAALINAS